MMTGSIGYVFYVFIKSLTLRPKNISRLTTASPWMNKVHPEREGICIAANVENS